jgi:hypothetical protein
MILFFQLLPCRFCHALCSSDVFHSFMPHSFQTHFTTCACTVCSRFIFCGREVVAALPLFVRALYRAWLRPHPPRARRGRACRLTAICIDRSSSIIQVSRIQSSKSSTIPKTAPGAVVGVCYRRHQHKQSLAAP